MYKTEKQSYTEELDKWILEKCGKWFYEWLRTLESPVLEIDKKLGLKFAIYGELARTYANRERSE